jgi:hypothetical protein
MVLHRGWRGRDLLPWLGILSGERLILDVCTSLAALMALPRPMAGKLGAPFRCRPSATTRGQDDKDPRRVAATAGPLACVFDSVRSRSHLGLGNTQHSPEAGLCLTRRLHLSAARAFRSEVQSGLCIVSALHLPPRRR